MSFDRLYERVFAPQKICGRLKFGMGENLRQRLADAKVPNDPGVYVIEGPDGYEPSVVYIGMAGTWHQATGGFGDQGLRERIPKTHDNVEGQEFLEKGMTEKKWQSVAINWLSLQTPGSPILPAKVEADLVQAFLDEYGNLPEWNKKF